MDIEKVIMPSTYMRNGKEHVLDPIRQRLILITPEEVVRQKVIQCLMHELNVPREMLRVEEPLVHYGLKTKLRADIVIEYFDEKDSAFKPVAIVETKAPNVALGTREFEQVQQYADMLGCNYIMLANGSDFMSYFYSVDKNQYVPIKTLPQYRDMLAEKYQPLAPMEPYKRCPYDELTDFVEALQDEWTFAPGSPKEKLVPMANFYSCLMDVSHVMPAGDYGLFKLIEDYGIRMLNYGNASGVGYSNTYRSFLIEADGNTQFVSLGINAYSDKRTIICVAIDDETSSHHALQLAIDTYMTLDRKRNCKFTHTGRIAVGRSGSGKASELLQYVESRYPKIIKDGKYELGTLTDNRNWYIDDSNVKEFIVNLISYALIRDEYREYVKQHQNK